MNNLDQLRDWKKYNSEAGKSLYSILQIDTGMNRLGLTPTELYKILDNPAEMNGANLCGLMSHLACSDEPNHEMNQKQLSEFTKAKNKLKWEPILKFDETVKMTTHWYKNFYNKKKISVYNFSKKQIKEYSKKTSK